MRSPWVRREQYDAVKAMQSAMIERLTVELQSMTARYHMLKLQGFTEPQTITPFAPAAVNPIDSAIAKMSRGNARLAEHMRTAAMIELASGVSPDVVVQNIYTGVRATDE